MVVIMAIHVRCHPDCISIGSQLHVKMTVRRNIGKVVANPYWMRRVHFGEKQARNALGIERIR